MSEARLRVRRALRECIPGDSELVLVACSGGADSLALALAAGDEIRAGRARIGAVIIDHGLQVGSAEVAERAAEACRRAGLDPVEVVRVEVALGPGHGGPEAAARTARRTALQDAAHRHGASAVLLAHTRDDQAETVLLRLARGSGARSLAAMAPVEGLWRRPLLDLPRDLVRSSLDGERAWEDPHNDDSRYARVRVRAEVMPALVAGLGSDVVDGLARSARLLRDDADALDAAADLAWPGVIAAESGGTALDVDALASLPRAIRTRLLKRAALEAGVPANDLAMAHVDRMEALVSDWRGQGAIDLPGGVGVRRSYGRLEFGRVASVDERRGRHPQDSPAPEE